MRNLIVSSLIWFPTPFQIHWIWTPQTTSLIRSSTICKDWLQNKRSKRDKLKSDRSWSSKACNKTMPDLHRIQVYKQQWICIGDPAMGSKASLSIKSDHTISRTSLSSILLKYKASHIATTDSQFKQINKRFPTATANWLRNRYFHHLQRMQHSTMESPTSQSRQRPSSHTRNFWTCSTNTYQDEVRHPRLQKEWTCQLEIWRRIVWFPNSTTPTKSEKWQTATWAALEEEIRDICSRHLLRRSRIGRWHHNSNRSCWTGRRRGGIRPRTVSRRTEMSRIRKVWLCRAIRQDGRTQT